MSQHALAASVTWQFCRRSLRRSWPASRKWWPCRMGRVWGKWRGQQSGRKEETKTGPQKLLQGEEQRDESSFKRMNIILSYSQRYTSIVRQLAEGNCENTIKKKRQGKNLRWSHSPEVTGTNILLCFPPPFFYAYMLHMVFFPSFLKAKMDSSNTYCLWPIFKNASWTVFPVIKYFSSQLFNDFIVFSHKNGT